MELSTDITGSGGKATNTLADFLLGQVKTANYAIPQPLLGRRNFNVGWYVQDDVRLTPRLTANLGVRYDYESPMYIATDRYSRFDGQTGVLLVANKNASRTSTSTLPVELLATNRPIVCGNTADGCSWRFWNLLRPDHVESGWTGFIPRI